MASSSSSSLVFTVKRSEPELIAPAKATPYEIKNLSDIDDQKGLRFHHPSVLFYRNIVGMEGRDPVKIIREAIAKALVYYYPLAGRLREGPNHKLMVECTGEGVLYIEADAYVKLEQFDVLQPPFPCMEDLLYDVPGSSGILGCPLLLMQVTRLICGGFVFAARFNHTMCDGTGMSQFMHAVAEIAHGAHSPSIQPIWKRELISARDTPCVSCIHTVYNKLPSTKGMPVTDVVHAHRSFFFGSQEIATLRSYVPAHLRSCSKFEILTAFLWRCRTVALGLNANDEVRVGYFVNARDKFNPPLPTGYYGNVLGIPAILSTAGKLLENPLWYALDLVHKVKTDVNEEFIRSTADLLVKNGRPNWTIAGTFLVSDLTRMAISDLDVGWGKALYGGPAGGGAVPAEISFFVSARNSKGEDGTVATIILPESAMKKFAVEIKKILAHPKDRKSSFLVSPL